MDDALAQRVDALERALTNGDGDLTDLTEEAEALDRLDDVETTVEELQRRVEELEAATQALRGYVGNVRSVNDDVKQQAETALSKAETALQQQPNAAAAGAGRVPAAGDPNASVKTPSDTMAADGATDAKPQPTPAAATDRESKSRPAAATDRAGSDTPHRGGDAPTAASADGGVPDRDSIAADSANTPDSARYPAGTPDSPRCHACGRTHPEGNADHQSAADGTTATGTAQGEAESLVPDEEPETSTLRRIRDLL